MSVAVLGFSAYCFSAAANAIVPATASRRLISPSMVFRQVGEFESSKSAMETCAPEFSALITILRSTGPVISTRRSIRSRGIGATRQSAPRTSAVLGRKVGRAPASNSRWRATRRFNKSRRRGSNRRARSATNCSAGSDRISAKAGVTGASTLASARGSVSIEVTAICFGGMGKCCASGPGGFLLPTMRTRSPIGQSVPRREGAAKVIGTAQYTDDLATPGAWLGKTIRSTVPRGRGKSVTIDPAFNWSSVDRPAGPGQIRHREEPVLLIAAPDRDTLAEAARHVRIAYHQEQPVLDIADATEVFSTVEIAKGQAFEEVGGVEVVEERTFKVGSQEQLYIEPQGAIAFPLDDGGVKIIGSLQCPYYVHRALKRALKLSDRQAVVIQAETGGGVGGTEEYPSIVAIHAALLARKAGRPVRLIYDRHEDLAATTKRHPGVIRHRTAVKKDGTLLAQDIEIVLDGGAYCTLTPVVLSRAAIHAAGAYACPNVRIRARAVMTNTPPNGAREFARWDR